MSNVSTTEFDKFRYRDKDSGEIVWAFTLADGEKVPDFVMAHLGPTKNKETTFVAVTNFDRDKLGYELVSIYNKASFDLHMKPYEEPK